MTSGISRNLALAFIFGATLVTTGACQRTASTTEEAKATEKTLNAYWTELSAIPTNLPRRTDALPPNYRLLKLDLPALRSHLNKDLANQGSKTLVDIPLVTGRQVTFSVTESAVMDPKLAARYPGMKTYKGNSIRNQPTELRMELSRNGLKASVTEEGIRYLVEPYLPGDSVHYISYERPQRSRQAPESIKIKGGIEKPVKAND